MTRDAPAFFRGIGGVLARLGPAGATANARDAIAERMHIDYVVTALERQVCASAPPAAEEGESRTA